MTKSSEYVKVAEAAVILGVSQGTVRAWAEAGKIPMRRNPANGYRLFRRADLEEFLRKISKPTKPKSRKRSRFVSQPPTRASMRKGSSRGR